MEVDCRHLQAKGKFEIPTSSMQTVLALALAALSPPEDLLNGPHLVSVEALARPLRRCLWSFSLDPARKSVPIIDADGRLQPGFVPWFLLCPDDLLELAEHHHLSTSSRSSRH